MKTLLFTLLLLVTGAASQAQTPTDITFHTRVEKSTLNYLIDKTRVIMTNAQVSDILTGEAIIEATPTFTLEEMTSDPDLMQLRDVFAKVFKTELKGAQVRIRVPKAFYQIEKLLVTPKGLNVVDPKLTLAIEAAIEGLRTELTEGLNADIMIPGKDGQLQSFLTAKLAPVTMTIPSSMGGMRFGIEFDTIRDQGFKFNLKSFDGSEIPTYVDRHKADLVILDSLTKKPITPDQIQINPVIVRLNSLQRSVSFDAFKPILQKKMPQIIGSVLGMLGNSLKEKIGPKILTTIFSNNTRSELMVTTEYIHTRYSTALFSQPVKDQLLVGMEGGFCTSKLFKEHGENCYAKAQPYEPVRELTKEDHQKGIDDITQRLAQGKSDLVISLTENYINRLIKTTIDAQLWDERLEEDHLWLGPKGVFAVFDKRTQQPEMFIDLYYGGEGGIQRLFVSENRPIRFPLRLSTSVSFPIKDGVPHLVIRTEKLLSDQLEIINGIPEYGLNSKLVRGFKKKIARMILKMAGKLEGQVAVDLDFPIMKNVGVEKTTYEATPYGRLNWYFKL
jgi:hypothetical protein